MSVDVVTDLLGEIVEIYEWNSYSSASPGCRLRARGHVRAVYVADKHLHVLVEHDLGRESAAYDEDGGFATYSLGEDRVRAVQRCKRCSSWDQKSLLMAIYPGDGLEKAWEHKSGEGCKKVGHGG